MNILIIDIDSQIPNIALHKIEKYHTERGDLVKWNFPLYSNISKKIYVSCIFDWNKHLCKEWEGIAEIGGTGYSLTKRLPEEIDHIKVKINVGFTSRGCIRNCAFCVVPQKEGTFKVVGDLYDFWDGKSQALTLLDNNILADPKHFKMICGQAQKENIHIDFNQGLDCRLLTDEICLELKRTRVSRYRFAFDRLKDKGKILKAIDLLKKYKLNRTLWYAFTDGDFEDVFERLMILKEQGQRAYLMRDKRMKSDKRMIDLAQWTNKQEYFATMSFKYFRENVKKRGIAE